MVTALLFLLIGGDPAPAARWTVESAAHTIPHATLDSLNMDGVLRIRADAESREVARVFELRRSGAALPALLTRNFVCLTNGDRIALDEEAPATLDQSRLRVLPAKSLQSLSEKAVSLYVPNVVMLFWAVPDGVEDAERFFADVEKGSRKRDIVYLRSGDRLEGTVTTLSGKDGCVAAVGNRKVHTPWANLAGIAWSTDRQTRLRSKKAYWRAVLADGSRVNLLEAGFEPKTRRWVGATQFGANLDLPETSVVALDRRQGEAIDLADLTPTRYEQQPYLSVGWPLGQNASVTGPPIRLGGNTYEHGIGVHAPCRVEYKLDGQYQRFVANVGIHDAARRGRARVALELDGKRIDLNEGKEMTSQTTPIPVRVDLAGVRTLTLMVEPGAFGDVQAHVDFAKARLIKKD